MSRFVLSPSAKGDIDQIWEYTAQSWDTDQADRYTRKIGEAVRLLAQTPGLGRDYSHIREGYRVYAVGSHLLFYRLLDDTIVIVRVLHRKMDVSRHLR